MPLFIRPDSSLYTLEILNFMFTTNHSPHKNPDRSERNSRGINFLPLLCNYLLISRQILSLIKCLIVSGIVLSLSQTNNLSYFAPLVSLEKMKSTTSPSLLCKFQICNTQFIHNCHCLHFLKNTNHLFCYIEAIFFKHDNFRFAEISG